MKEKTAARRALDEIRIRRAAGRPPEPIAPPARLPALEWGHPLPAPPMKRVVGETMIAGLPYHLLDCTHVAAIEIADLDGGAMRRPCLTCRDIAAFGAPRPAALVCPSCGKAHVDEGRLATLPHRTHRCVDDAAGAGCRATWTLAETVRGVLCGACGHPHARFGCVEAGDVSPSCCCAPIAEVATRWADDADFRRALLAHELHLGAPQR